MKIILLLLVLLGMSTAATYKFLIEPKILDKNKTRPVEDILLSQPETSGFTVKTLPTSSPVGSTASVDSGSKSLPELVISTKSDKKAIILKFSNLGDVATIAYIITYKTATVNRGIQATIERLKGELTISREIVLGTCSAATCVYDSGVKNISVSLTYTYEDGAKATSGQTYTVE